MEEEEGHGEREEEGEKEEEDVQEAVDAAVGEGVLVFMVDVKKGESARQLAVVLLLLCVWWRGGREK